MQVQGCWPLRWKCGGRGHQQLVTPAPLETLTAAVQQQQQQAGVAALQPWRWMQGQRLTRIMPQQMLAQRWVQGPAPLHQLPMGPCRNTTRRQLGSSSSSKAAAAAAEALAARQMQRHPWRAAEGMAAVGMPWRGWRWQWQQRQHSRRSPCDVVLGGLTV
jgi:hypothetical protein